MAFRQLPGGRRPLSTKEKAAVLERDLQMERDAASDAEVESVFDAVDRVRTGILGTLVVEALSNGHHTVPEIAECIDMRTESVAAVARALVEGGLATEPSPGRWRLTTAGWNRAHEIEDRKRSTE